MDSQCPGCLGQAVVTLRLPSAIVESLWRHKRVPFVNIASVRSRSIKRRQRKHKMDYYGVVFAHLATGRGINAKDPSGLDSDRWIPHSRCCENPARALASRHLSAGFTDLNPSPRGLSLYNSLVNWAHLMPKCVPLLSLHENLLHACRGCKHENLIPYFDLKILIRAFRVGVIVMYPFAIILTSRFLKTLWATPFE